MLTVYLSIFAVMGTIVIGWFMLLMGQWSSSLTGAVSLILFVISVYVGSPGLMGWSAGLFGFSALIFMVSTGLK